MHEGQIKERPHGCVGFLIETPSKSAVCYGARQVVGCERARTIAEHVAGKLVEENQKGERSFRAFFKSRELTPRRRLMNRKKPRPDGPVKIFISFEPFVGPGLAPEGYNLGQGGVAHLHVSSCGRGRLFRLCGLHGFPVEFFGQRERFVVGNSIE